MVMTGGRVAPVILARPDSTAALAPAGAVTAVVVAVAGRAVVAEAGN